MPKPTKTTASGSFFRLLAYKKKKFGQGRAGWIVFEETMQEVLGRVDEVANLSNAETLAMIEALKRLPDAKPEGQGVLGV